MSTQRKLNFEGNEFKEEKDNLYILPPQEIYLDHEIVIPQIFKESIICDELQPPIRETLGNIVGKGALVYGFPGVGKTSLIKQLAKKENAYIVFIEKDMTVTEIRKAFNKAREIAKSNKVFVVIDEIDDFGSKEFARYTGSLSKIIALMTEIDGIKELKNNMYVFGITNFLEEVDHRLLRPGRLEEIIEIPFPNKEERIEIIETIAKEVKNSEKILKYKDIISKKTNGYTPADLRGIIKHCQIMIAKKNELTENDVLEIVSKFKPTVKRSFMNFEEPQISLDDVVGRELYINFFKEILNKEKRENATFLLYGPRGVGKTIFPEALAHFFEYSFIKVRGSELQEGIVGEGTKNLKRLFNVAKLSAPCIVLLDEIEGIITKRGTISHKDDETAYINAVVGDLLRQKNGIYFFATTNNPLLINTTTLSRFQYKIFFELPEETEREKYFKRYLNTELNTEIASYFSDLAKSTEGCSYRDLYNITQIINRYVNKTNGKNCKSIIEKYRASQIVDEEDWEKIKEQIGDSLEIEKFIESLKNG